MRDKLHDMDRTRSFARSALFPQFPAMSESRKSPPARGVAVRVDGILPSGSGKGVDQGGDRGFRRPVAVVGEHDVDVPVG